MFNEGDNLSACPRAECKKDRYNNDRKAAATVKQVSIAEQLALLISNESFRKNIVEYKTSCSRTQQNHNPELLADIFDGELLRSSKDPIPGVMNIHLAMYCDGFNPFKRGGVNMNVVMFVVLNLPPEIR